ncbi:NCK-associated protein 1 [Fasciola gigantica]|uniref:NCK-associated protein 1 n=1 Tax=Fasciola gigantica TaxID=46835 RepID=A0A504YAX6_FASGI|nr:NCK-associated protein 1 [Fasciola gigantica]
MTVPISHQKLAERLFILNDRQLGVLTRLHHMKQLLSSPDYRPAVMPGGDKVFEPAWKVLLKKFPSIEFRSGQSSIQPFITHQKGLFGVMSTYYYNLADVLEVRDNFSDLLGRFSASQIQLDITVNSDITRLYLELVSNYFAMMFFLTRIPDVKAILALFNFLYDQLNGKPEPNYPRMAELFTETPDAMLRTLHAEINPHAKTISRALNSLSDFFVRRTVRAQNWSDGHFLNILNEPGKIAHTVLGDQLACELIPYEMMERWVVFGYLLIYPELSDEDAFNRLKTALKHTYVVVLFRDEVVYIHALLQSFLESVWTNKVGAKRISEIKETLSIACSQTLEVHADRRAYLRSALRQLHLILADEPGLLGPKAFLVFWGLSYAADEVQWLLRHLSNPPVKKSSTSSSRSHQNPTEEFGDPFLPELLFYMEELRLLIVRYTPVIQRFYVQLLACYDAPGLREYAGEILPRLPGDEAIILSSISKQLLDLSDEQVLQDTTQNCCEQFAIFDFSGIRLDWLRLQTSMSCKTAPIMLADHRRLVEHLHSTIFHTKLVDYLDELLRLVSDMSVFIFYPTQFADLFAHCLMCPAQLRFTIVFPSVCCHAVQACHDLCPEERAFLGRSSIRIAHHFCQKIADRVCADFLTRVDEFGNLADQLAPQTAVPWLFEDRPAKRKGKKVSSTGRSAVNGTGSNEMSKSKSLSGKIGTVHGNDVRFVPGMESFRRNREEQTTNDRTLFSLSQLCQAVINPREVLQNEIQARLIEVLASYSECTPVTDHSDELIIPKPSDLLRRVRALMDALVDLEHHVCIDVIGIFSTVFTQHTQPRDGFKGHLTMTAHYTKWYVEHLIKHAYADHFVYSPLLKSFVTMVSPEVVRFRAEDFADLNELRALAELIGPLGMKHMSDQLMQDVGHRVDEIKKLVLQNRSTLESLRECFDDPQKTRQVGNSLQNSDTLLVLLKEIGVALAFRKLCCEALNDVLQKRTPFLLSTVHNLRNYVTQQSGGQLLPPTPGSAAAVSANGIRDDVETIYARFDSQLVLNNLSASMGILSDLDYSLCAILNSRRSAALAASQQANAGGPMNGVGAVPFPDLDYHIACLFIVFVANALPRLARQESSAYHLDLEANENNTHCLAYSVNALMVAMFSLLRPGDLEARSKEFLALASSSLLRLGLETSTSVLSSEVCGGAIGIGGGAGGGTGIGSSGGQSFSSSSSSNPNPTHPAKQRDSIYILFDNLIRHSPCLSHSLQEACFPYSLIRSAYHNVAKASTIPAIRSNMMSASHAELKSRD